MQTATVNLTLRDLTFLLTALRSTSDALMKQNGEEVGDEYEDLVMYADLIKRLKAEHTTLLEAATKA
ncbi:MAG: hypothetical protein ACTHL8_12940 [Burkholderiaceae bacterium]